MPFECHRGVYGHLWTGSDNEVDTIRILIGAVRMDIIITLCTERKLNDSTVATTIIST